MQNIYDLKTARPVHIKVFIMVKSKGFSQFFFKKNYFFFKKSLILGMSPLAVCGTGIIKPTRSGRVLPGPWTTGGGILLLHTNDSSTPDGTTGKVGGLLPPDPTGRLVPEVDLRGCVGFFR